MILGPKETLDGLLFSAEDALPFSIRLQEEANMADHYNLTSVSPAGSASFRSKSPARRPEGLLNDAEAAECLGLSSSTMRSWRCRGIGPAYTKLGPGEKAPVRYSVADLEAFIAEGRHIPPVRAARER